MEFFRELVYQWLMNEKLLGEETIEIVGTISLDKKVKDTQMGESKNLGQEPQIYPGSSRSSDLPKLGMRDTQVGIKDTQMAGIETQKITALNELVMKCKKCALHTRRNKLVFGDGNSASSIVFIGEAPGREENECGLPFVGNAGKLLTSLLKSVGIDRSAVYITNIIKCWPPGNRDPLPEELNSCFEWLDKQLEIIAPKLICTLGRHSTFSLLGSSNPIDFYRTLSFSKFRGKVYEYKGIKVVPTYHPAALLYHPNWEADTISDLTLVKEMLDSI